MFYRGLNLCRTINIRTPKDSFTLFLYHLSTAHRTDYRHYEFFLYSGSISGYRFYNLWNNITRSLNYNRIQFSDIFFFYLILIMQSRSPYGNTSDLNRFQMGNRCKGPGPAYLNLYR